VLCKIQQSSDPNTATNGASAASEANLQTFLDTFVCQANANSTGYFFFEVSFVAINIHLNDLDVTRVSCCSTSMSLGKTYNLAVLRVGGVCFTPSNTDLPSHKTSLTATIMF
jgi:hypothetical protein